jgi:hypothetical protein
MYMHNVPQQLCNMDHPASESLSPLWPLSDTVMQFIDGNDFSPSASPCVIHAENLRSCLAQYVMERVAMFERVCRKLQA